MNTYEYPQYIVALCRKLAQGNDDDLQEYLLHAWQKRDCELHLLLYSIKRHGFALYRQKNGRTDRAPRKKTVQLERSPMVFDRDETLPEDLPFPQVAELLMMGYKPIEIRELLNLSKFQVSLRMQRIRDYYA
jgi:hypothetical protein